MVFSSDPQIKGKVSLCLSRSANYIFTVFRRLKGIFVSFAELFISFENSLQGRGERSSLIFDILLQLNILFNSSQTIFDYSYINFVYEYVLVMPFEGKIFS